jgi:general secretion pathway protein D
MIGLTEEITAVDQIIDSLDVPQQDLRVISEYEIQYVDIEKIVAALKELGIIDTAVAGAQSGPAARSRTPAAPAAPAPSIAAATEEGPVSLDQPQIVMLEFTNSLLVNATPEQHIQIAQIISYVDREPVQAAIPYRIYRLENQEPEALAEVLNNLIEKTVKDKEGKIQQTIKYSEEDIAIVPDKNTFSLIVYASRKNQEWIGNLIKSLDTRRPQVLIDVSLVEITRDDKFQFDLDVIANATTLVSNNIGITSSAISSGFPSTSPADKLFEGGYFAGDTENVGFFNEGRIQALFDLIDKKGYGRILARPKILVNDNELGKIERTETEYVAQTTTTALPGQTQTDTVQTSTSYTPYQAKISLEITPQISEGELLRLEIAMIREDFAETGTTGAPKNTTTNNINTIVTVPDGSTIILGGLTKLNQSKTGNKVPLLGDVPIVGTLFRSTKDIDKANKLYVFVKANILRPEQTLGLGQLKRISQKNRDEFEEAEKKFQLHETFPGIKPKPMDPERVLERDEDELEPLTLLKQK